MDGFDLSGRTAVVIGGGSGIGREIALAYREAGATSVVVGHTREKLDRVSAELGGTGAPPLAYAADVTAVSGLDALAARIEVDHGPVDILVNCQGTTEIKPALELTEAEYDRILDTNLKSVFFACTAFGRRMVERRRGAIVNITSLAAYSASKMGVDAVTRTLAAEWGERGVRVNAIAPGFFLTELNRDRMPPARKEEARRRSAMGRMGALPELRGAAIFLASDAAAFVTGSTIRVDGGYLASGI